MVVVNGTLQAVDGHHFSRYRRVANNAPALQIVLADRQLPAECVIRRLQAHAQYRDADHRLPRRILAQQVISLHLPVRP